MWNSLSSCVRQSSSYPREKSPKANCALFLCQQFCTSAQRRTALLKNNSKMILIARKYLYITNILFFCLVFIIQKFVQIFCIIEEKACKNANCTTIEPCENDGCPVANDNASASVSASNNLTPPPSPVPPVKGLRLIPAAMRKAMDNFGFGEGHYQIFVEEKQRQQPLPNKSRLNAAVAEVKLNPN